LKNESALASLLIKYKNKTSRLRVSDHPVETQRLKRLSNSTTENKSPIRRQLRSVRTREKRYRKFSSLRIQRVSMASRQETRRFKSSLNLNRMCSRTSLLGPPSQRQTKTILRRRLSRTINRF